MSALIDGFLRGIGFTLGSSLVVVLMAAGILIYDRLNPEMFDHNS